MKNIILPLLSLLILLSTAVAAKDSEEIPLPGSKEELAKWLVGTEWILRQKDAEKIVRFYSKGKMQKQPKAHKWNTTYPGNHDKYKVLSGNSIQFGKTKNIGTFNKDFTRMDYATRKKDAKGKSGNGSFRGRFELTKE